MDELEKKALEEKAALEKKAADEKKALEEKELEQRLTGKYAEGAKKATKELLDQFGVKTAEELKARYDALNGADSKLKTTEETLSKLQAERIAIKNGASFEMAEDAIALLKGKGQELTEENIKTVVDKWIKQGGTAGTPGGILPNGKKQGDDKPPVKRVF
jgi:hypothetical protein